MSYQKGRLSDYKFIQEPPVLLHNAFPTFHRHTDGGLRDSELSGKSRCGHPKFPRCPITEDAPGLLALPVLSRQKYVGGVKIEEAAHEMEKRVEIDPVPPKLGLTLPRLSCGTTGPTNVLFFAAGIDDEAHGLFGRIRAIEFFDRDCWDRY